MVAWAIRTAVLWGVICAVCLAAWDNRALLLPPEKSAAPPQRQAAQTAPRPVATAPPKSVAANTISLRTDARGHVMLEAAVNGAPVRFMVDTGASFVTLTQDDALSAGIGSGDLHFTTAVSTANGEVRVARVKLREIRVDQFTMEDVDAVVVDSPLNVSLLGMSFLSRLDGYEMRDGAMIMSW